MPPGQMVGALGAEAARIRSRALPKVVLRALPSLRRAGVLSAVPLPAYIAASETGLDTMLSHGGPPACGAPFQA